MQFKHKPIKQYAHHDVVFILSQIQALAAKSSTCIAMPNISPGGKYPNKNRYAPECSQYASFVDYYCFAQTAVLRINDITYSVN